MKAKFEEEPKKIKTHVQPPIGNYALDSDPAAYVHWYHCREQFAVKFIENTIGFYFSHPHGKSFDIGEFITKFESILNIDNISRFAKTEKETVLWIEPSKFWKDCQIKRSLLTLIVRCGINYDSKKDNFDDALFGQYKESAYIKETRSAVLRFMFGFTRFTGIIAPVMPSATVVKHGWREEFLKIDDVAVRRKLALPEDTKKETSIVGVESLWI
jgi:hypothetical protein